MHAICHSQGYIWSYKLELWWKTQNVLLPVIFLYSTTLPQFSLLIVHTEIMNQGFNQLLTCLNFSRYWLWYNIYWILVKNSKCILLPVIFIYPTTINGCGRIFIDGDGSCLLCNWNSFIFFIYSCTPHDF